MTSDNKPFIRAQKSKLIDIYPPPPPELSTERVFWQRGKNLKISQAY